MDGYVYYPALYSLTFLLPVLYFKTMDHAESCHLRVTILHLHLRHEGSWVQSERERGRKAQVRPIDSSTLI